MSTVTIEHEPKIKLTIEEYAQSISAAVVSSGDIGIITRWPSAPEFEGEIVVKGLNSFITIGREINIPLTDYRTMTKSHCKYIPGDYLVRVFPKNTRLTIVI